MFSIIAAPTSESQHRRNLKGNRAKMKMMFSLSFNDFLRRDNLILFLGRIWHLRRVVMGPGFGSTLIRKKYAIIIESQNLVGLSRK